MRTWYGRLRASRMIPAHLCQVNVLNGKAVIHHTAAVGATPPFQAFFTDSVRVWLNRLLGRWPNHKYSVLI